MYDLVIKNGYVVDPGNRISSKLNIGISEGRIKRISNESLEGDSEIDADSLVVSPGFIDAHMHEDNYDTEKDEFNFCISNSMLKMGVTTVLGGNCGIGPKDPIQYLDAVDRKGFPINIALYSPHECLRNACGNFNKYNPVDQLTIKKMCQLLDSQLEQGCIGLSLGIEYIPGIDNTEISQLSEVAANRNKIVAAHVREDAANMIPSIIEVTDLVKPLNIPIHISHISSQASFGQMQQVLSLLDEYRCQGLDIESDSYPYYAYCTGIGTTNFDDGFLERYNLSEEDYSLLEVASGKYKGKRCTRAVFEELRKSDPGAFIIAHVLNEKEVDMAICHPASIVSSDGIYLNGQGHPRGSGAFPRLINEFVKNKKLLTLDKALEKITYLPAKRFGFKNKGTLSIGADADITIFDMETIKDCATFENPLLPPKGIEYVLIKGQIALAKGIIKNSKLGRSIRK